MISIDDHESSAALSPMIAERSLGVSVADEYEVVWGLAIGD